MSFFKEFKEFAMRGNVIDLAVAVVIGAAFNKIVSALVDGIIMPFIGVMVGGINVANKTLSIGSVTLKWGLLLQSVIDFTLIAFSIFVVIKMLNILQQRQEILPKKLTGEEVLLKEIRDILKDKAKEEKF